MNIARIDLYCAFMPKEYHYYNNIVSCPDPHSGWCLATPTRRRGWTRDYYDHTQTASNACTTNLVNHEKCLYMLTVTS